jgi:hypothetical protein
MTEFPRVELPAILAQSEQAARLGAGRPGPSEMQRLEDEAYDLELLSRQRNEEVQASERVAGSHERNAERDDRQRDGQAHHRRPDLDDEPGDDERHVDIIA